jgi:hypothetical protein
LFNVTIRQLKVLRKEMIYIGKLPNCLIVELISGSSSFGRAIAFQAIGGQFEPGLPLKKFF